MFNSTLICRNFVFKDQNKVLRYYVTFEVRKFESLIYKILHIFTKKYHLHWIAGRANIICKYIIYILFHSILGMTFTIPFLLFFKALASYGKKTLKQFLLYCTSICLTSKSVSQIFEILFQTGDINIFVLRGVFF